ncbi:MAG TPA: sulfur carrier protein ThiS [Pyrinomonadaceae bacterium]
MRIQINGEPHDLPASTADLPSAMNLVELIAYLKLAPERLAVEHNRQVVRRADWSRTFLSEGDQIEIVHFVGGG